MKRYTLITSLLVVFILSSFQSAQAQEDKYKIIQGLGYLHTQVTLLIDHWKYHPLNDIPMDDISEEYYDHFLEEFEHDEEWVEFMMVEENLMKHFGEDITEEVATAIEDNLVFYEDIYEKVKKPGVMSKELEGLKEKMKEADHKFYHTILPALCN